eukprot:TRINITY_DN494_c0_g1_i2.p1 TRINITY_DN494_c0_g1~~TRINITY_DN494_c0_g1_i2.p1  ORF type:complete len:261 (+),score=60.60 TRINITY_DN494_c0_g1_i2:223-1005(+)
MPELVVSSTSNSALPLQAAHAMQQMRDNFNADPGGEIILKQLSEGSYSSTFDMGEPGSPPPSKKRKTNGEHQVKRHKYDVLKAFFRVYFKIDKDEMVPKDSIYFLYAKKIASDNRIARNAMYRHMWSYFKDRISALQSNYREYVKGIKLLTNGAHLNYDGVEKDLELLRSIGLNSSELFDFTEEELIKPDKVPNGTNNGNPSMNGTTSTTSYHMPNNPYMEPDGGSLISYIEQLENTAKNLVAALKELKTKVRERGGDLS